eukprot:scaffold275134_cov28-Tisochrysis_lutea.AAC.1
MEAPKLRSSNARYIADGQSPCRPERLGGGGGKRGGGVRAWVESDSEYVREKKARDLRLLHSTNLGFII